MINFYQYYSSPLSLDHYVKYGIALEDVITEYKGSGTNYTKHKWDKVRHIFKTTSSYAYEYAQYVIKERWPEAEHAIINSLDFAHVYASNVIKGRWPELEQKMINGQIEPYPVYVYTRDVVNEPWPEVEPIILTECEAAYFYASYILMKRWPEAEELLLRSYAQDSDHVKYQDACYYIPRYAEFVIRGEWPEAEPLLKLSERDWTAYQAGVKQNNIRNQIKEDINE